MKKRFIESSVLLFWIIIFLCACSSKSEQMPVDSSVENETIISMETATEPTEPEIEPEPEWLSESAIEEAYACLFPLDGEKNIELAQEILLPLVESGNAEAMYYWGYIYHTELASTSEESEGQYWYRLAAEQGFPKACLGVIDYAKGDEKNRFIELAQETGVFETPAAELGADGCTLIGLYYEKQEQYKLAMDWYLNASDLGSTKGMNQIGGLYESGLGHKQDTMLALEWYLKGANLGDPLCMNNYGHALSQYQIASEYIEKQYASSVESYRLAAEEGNAVAMYNLGYLYKSGLGGVSYSYNTAMEWYEKAANAGDVEAMNALGFEYQSGYGKVTDYQLAMEWYLKAANLGSSKAMHSIGQMYQQGHGVEPNEQTAKEWFDKSAQAYLEGQETGDMVHINYVDDRDNLEKSGKEWLHKAATAGILVAMDNYGYIFWKQNMHYNADSARQWYKKAADLGLPAAMNNLGSSYKDTEEYDAAMEYYIKAYVNGYGDNQKIRKLLAKKQGVNGFFENYGEFISPNS